ncbi:MAG TPA: YceH family protein [Blastocatellia bacterium]|nr:YceH family protein [Blastocatellia bacterium]
MSVTLDEYEVRVLGALIEKEISTPEYYPLTLNALMNACNQKSSRDPVVSYDEQTVSRTLQSLRDKKLSYVFSGAEARVPKYGQLFNKFFDLSPQEVAVMCVLMLRGPQTPGELRSRTASLYNFEQLADVETTLQDLMNRDGEPLVARLPRQPGTKESRYAHLLSGPVEADMSEPIQRPVSSTSTARISEERIAKLEAEIAQLRQELSELRQEFAAFKTQFE